MAKTKCVSIEIASARGVADKWKEQYFDSKGREWMVTSFGPSKAVYEKLCAFGKNPDIDAVAKVIGNKSWSYISCDSCWSYVNKAVRLGGEFGESKIYCSSCVEQAHKALEGSKK